MATGEVVGGVITGTVVTRDGWPVEHAVVTVVDATGTQSGRAAVGHGGRDSSPRHSRGVGLR